MRYSKTLEKLKAKCKRYLKTAKREFDNRAFREPDGDIFYLNIENAIEDLIKAILLGEDAVDEKKENPCI